ncbi:MarR family winged helix-turn-helix transcriptional regulator [Solihabitans fulvus]|uniref:MarR family winged helix-turn-helix transcriptional regulator n=1 Tax=Solihabitans fulvus TaxID=1892852 RepID=UPI001661BB0F|nr:MarR family winged helix-turn-helix transcriptional regulator [Solihabitans fulvus]
MPDIPGLPPQEQLLVGLSRLGQAVRICAYRDAGPHRLSPLQADVVSFLAGDPRPRRQAEIVEALASTPPTVSDALRALDGKNLVARHRDPADSRAAAVTLTDEGVAEARRLTLVPTPLREALDAVAPADVEGMLRGVSAMIAALQEHRAIPVSRMCVTCRFFQRDAHLRSARPHHCGFVDSPFADAQLRIECPDHEPRERNR